MAAAQIVFARQSVRRSDQGSVTLHKPLFAFHEDWSGFTLQYHQRATLPAAAPVVEGHKIDHGSRRNRQVGGQGTWWCGWFSILVAT